MWISLFKTGGYIAKIRWNWDRFSGHDVDYKCMDLNMLQWAINITNIIFDVVVLALPIPLVWRSMYFLKLVRRNTLKISSAIDTTPKNRHHHHVQPRRRRPSRQLSQNALQHSLRPFNKHNLGLHGPNGLGRHRKLRQHRRALSSHSTTILTQSIPTIIRTHVRFRITCR